MRQLLLDLGAEKPQTLDSFVVGRNAELLELAHRLAGPESVTLSQRFVYLWGEPGSGKTHLLHALASMPGAKYLDATSPEADFVADGPTRLYLLDDCDRLSPALQIAAFNLFNQIREGAAALVTTGAAPPAILQVREDLRTRLGWGLIYQVHGLTDEEKIAALTRAAHARGFALAPGVLPYLITHFRRDMRSLSAMLDALDAYSLETKRPITVPLLRNLLQLGEDPTLP
ncbi:MAG: DnaA regulatory inactivator Hda [Herminiimonas sp.]|nr:DnaA regulatory inactivator Hda [Herminiimonas sp.]